MQIQHYLAWVFIDSVLAIVSSTESVHQSKNCRPMCISSDQASVHCFNNEPRHHMRWYSTSRCIHIIIFLTLDPSYLPSSPPPNWATDPLWWGSKLLHAGLNGGSSLLAAVVSWWRRSRGSQSCPLPTWPGPLGSCPMGSAHISGSPPSCQTGGYL